MREDEKDAVERYIETVRLHLERGVHLRSSREQGWSERREKRWGQEIKPKLTRKVFLVKK